ncbi:unnamed protein product [Cylindrotheca closterium]|uniref:DDE Tnp4 domain-containing protein n=1 Tax=Cylindrotheca closterium TaxID=2856 RepID=A0AAD2PVK4_9STRA|nr:unnamed protein product [Cylindrotheca closterium]
MEDSDDLDARVFLGMNPNDPFDLFDESGAIDENGRRRRQTPRGREEKRDPSTSYFGKILKKADLNAQTKGSVWDEENRHGKTFRRRYRLPYVLFDKICQEYDKVDTRREVDAFNRPKSDSRMLIMGVLRYLGQVIPFDSLEELSDISGQKHQNYFHEFITWFSDPSKCPLAKEYLKMPESDEEIAHVTGNYKRKGVPGTGGSVDCFHVSWDMCPAGIRTDCKGKEKYNTVVFQVISSHTKKFLGVSGPYFGTWNDKTIARLDENLRALMPGGHLSTQKWCWVDSDGNEHEEEGLHLICDGGYHQWKILMCPFKCQQDGTAVMIWSKWIESLRKDVECVFGILKKRFMVLKYANRLRDIETIGKVFRTCCILHNMLLEFDGYDDWEEEFDEELVDVETLNDGQYTKKAPSYMREAGRDTTLKDGEIGDRQTNDEWCQDFSEADFHHRREALTEHYMALKQS